MKLKMLLLIFALIAGINLSLGFFTRQRWHNFELEQQRSAMTVYAASLQANVDFDHGLLRKYELSMTNKIGYSGRRDGAFEIWTWPANTEAGQPAQQTSQQFVDTYNDKMKYMVEHPEDFPPTKAATTQPVATR